MYGLIITITMNTSDKRYSVFEYSIHTYHNIKQDVERKFILEKPFIERI